MPAQPNPGLFIDAIVDFRRARFRAKVEQVLARLSGRSAELLEYEAVRRQLRATNQVSRGLQNIPIDAIVGSVGRAADYTRSFLPRQNQDEGRWAKVKVAMTGLAGLPPIEVYQIGQAYFVLDGNHRVSVARQLGAKSIQAHVTEIQTAVPLSPGVQLDDLIVKAEYAAFLERTGMARVRPEADLSVSVPGQYQTLEEHISVHQYFMGLDEEREVSYDEAVAHWYDTVYQPLIAIIREQGLLRDLRNGTRSLTETDLYLWILEHRAELGKALHWQIAPEDAAQDLVERFSSKPGRVVARVGERIASTVVPRTISDGPPVGAWRMEAERRQDRLFSEILVAVSGTKAGWSAVDAALQVAGREEGRLVGLHVVRDDESLPQHQKQAKVLEAEFRRRCKAAKVAWHWIIESGSVADRICAWGRWSHLAVACLSHPPGNQPLARLGSGFRALIQRCPLPVLAVPSAPHSGRVRVPVWRKLLLAYDGSPKANEALYITTYLAARWGMSLVVLTVEDSDSGQADPGASVNLAHASQYLNEHAVRASYRVKRWDGSGPSVGQAIVEAAEEYASDLIVMGGYGFRPVVQIVLGSAVDQVLRTAQQPVLICR